MSSYQPGDLVKYIGKVIPDAIDVPVVPPKKRPYGIVIEVKALMTGKPDDPGTGKMELILVKWFDESWNISGGGLAEEISADLLFIQRASAS
jgi:hypothetical protein